MSESAAGFVRSSSTSLAASRAASSIGPISHSVSTRLLRSITSRRQSPVAALTRDGFAHAARAPPSERPASRAIVPSRRSRRMRNSAGQSGRMSSRASSSAACAGRVLPQRARVPRELDQAGKDPARLVQRPVQVPRRGMPPPAAARAARGRPCCWRQWPASSARRVAASTAVLLDVRLQRHQPVRALDRVVDERAGMRRERRPRPADRRPRRSPTHGPRAGCPVPATPARRTGRCAVRRRGSRRPPAAGSRA